ncbi:Hypothetical predicted protein [Marmota monax]|uniref:Uncharacterized protein n=1 Tax=Marmota monax TaxID=9995 RepID=A0A5E4AFZ5_MARMO|nr:Hypothetical predicted protein [Marmota monax]
MLGDRDIMALKAGLCGPFLCPFSVGNSARLRRLPSGRAGPQLSRSPHSSQVALRRSDQDAGGVQRPSISALRSSLALPSRISLESPAATLIASLIGLLQRYRIGGRRSGSPALSGRTQPGTLVWGHQGSPRT